jgi:hypothetical protein
MFQETEYTLNNENNEATVILENCRKNNQIWTNYDREIHVTKIWLWIKKRNAVGDTGQINCSSEQRRKQRAPPPTRRRRCAHFRGFDTQYGIPGLVGGK